MQLQLKGYSKFVQLDQFSDAVISFIHFQTHTMAVSTVILVGILCVVTVGAQVGPSQPDTRGMFTQCFFLVFLYYMQSHNCGIATIATELNMDNK